MFQKNAHPEIEISVSMKIYVLEKAVVGLKRVYHVPSEVGTLYVKYQADVVTEFLLLSFKEKDNG